MYVFRYNTKLLVFNILLGYMLFSGLNQNSEHKFVLHTLYSYNKCTKKIIAN